MIARGRAVLLSIVALAGLFALTTLTAPRWARVLRGSPSEATDLGTEAQAAPAAPELQPSAVRLFFEATDRTGLAIEETSIQFSTDPSTQVRAIVEELFRGPRRAELRPTFPATARVLDALVTPGGIAVVNLSKDAAVGGVGTDGELLAVYSLVDSIVSNLPTIKRVQIIVESLPAPTLGGHVDLSRPLAADMSFLSDTRPTPAAAEAAPR